MMFETCKRKLLVAGTALGSATIFAAIPAVAWAQDGRDVSAAAAVESDNVIIVTARKKDESLQDVPLAISVFQGSGSKRRGLTTYRIFSFAYPAWASVNHSRASRQWQSAVLRRRMTARG